MSFEHANEITGVGIQPKKNSTKALPIVKSNVKLSEVRKL